MFTIACMGSKIVVDSAFVSNGRPLLYKSHQNNFDWQGNQWQCPLLHQQGTSVRQLSEWGMHGLHRSFPRLMDQLQYEECGEHCIILEMIALLDNFQASTVVGLNQIQSTCIHAEFRTKCKYLLWSKTLQLAKLILQIGVSNYTTKLAPTTSLL